MAAPTTAGSVLPQIQAPTTPQPPHLSPAHSGAEIVCQHVPLGEQTIHHTASRRSGPRRWLRAVEWAIAAGLHPQVTSTTLLLARDLADRMDYDTGHVRYAIDRTIARTGLARSTITKHAKILREMGLLVWVSHGSKTNIRRALGLSGYAGTATVYAAVIPPVYDHAMGHHRTGHGYTARIVVHHVSTASVPTTQPAHSSTDGPSWTPSLRVVKKDSQVQKVGGFNNTTRKRARRTTPSAPSDRSRTTRSPRQVARDILVARHVRPRVTWTQTEGLRRLAYALRPLIDRGLTSDDIAAELHSWFLTWRPARPASYIQARLTQCAAQSLTIDKPQPVDPMANPDWRAFCEEQRRQAVALAAQQTTDRTDEDRRVARSRGWYDLQEVAEHCADDPDDALDLYGATLCARAVRLTSSAAFRQGTWS
ncbi:MULTISPECIES: hypothetical protein [Streptomyces]|uniref:Replication protein n=1 Tax=Streptomyces ehimensis TaxID=68195 RepID=A0ABV9BQY5_9ACTN